MSLSTHTDGELSPMRIVIVEDDPASADVLKRRLEANGMVVAHGADGAEGLRLVREMQPDLVLLDVMLPDTNGYDVCLQLKSDQETAHIPVIFLSARGDVYDKVRGLSSGAADYLTKPFHPAELLARVDAVLRHAEARVPRLVLPEERATPDRPRATIALADPGRRARIEALLAGKFDIVSPSSSDPVDLVVLDEAGGAASTARSQDALVLRIPAGDRADVARFDADLVRLAETAGRQRRLDVDVQTATGALIALAARLEAHDRVTTPAHGQRVAARAVSIARVLGLNEAALETVRLGALLRDIGNAKVAPAILSKSTDLAHEERLIIEQHPIFGAELLAGFRPLAHIMPILRWHHERLDGSGYPDRLRAAQIPLEVRVVTVADWFEALLVDRVDRTAVSPSEAVRVLQLSVAHGEIDAAVVAALDATVQAELQIR
jgi:response regulator RpfG family c-di-GMP phosphodiesterase